MKKILFGFCILLCNASLAQSIVLDNYKKIVSEMKQIHFQKQTRNSQISAQINTTYKVNGSLHSKDSLVTILNNACTISQLKLYQINLLTEQKNLIYTIDYNYFSANELEKKTTTFDALGLIVNISYINCFYNNNATEDSVIFSEEQSSMGRVVTSKVINLYSLNKSMPDSTIVYGLNSANIFYITALESHVYNTANEEIENKLLIVDANNNLVNNCINYFSINSNGQLIDSFQKWDASNATWINNKLTISKTVSGNLLYSVKANFDYAINNWVASDSTLYFYSTPFTFDSMIVKNNTNDIVLKNVNLFDADGNNTKTNKYKFHSGSLYHSNKVVREFITCKALALDNVVLQNNVIAFPNPVFRNSEICINTNFNHGFELQLIDMFGKHIWKQGCISQNIKVQAPEVPGVYLLLFKDANKQKLGSQKIMVQ